MFSIKKFEIIIGLMERLAAIYKEVLILILFILLFGRDLINLTSLMIGA
jgi:hypothetical protein